MSTIKEKADIEAAITEAELTDAERETVLEQLERGDVELEQAIAAALEAREISAPDEQLEQPAVEASEPSDEQLQALDAELRRHREAVADIMGHFVAGFTDCDRCGGAGLVPPDPGPPSNELFKECPTCHGWAQVLTGSKDPTNYTRPCPGCKGRGYLEQLDQAGTPLATDQTVQPIPVPGLALESGAEHENDAGGEQETTRWGTPAWMGDPNLGS